MPTGFEKSVVPFLTTMNWKVPIMIGRSTSGALSSMTIVLGPSALTSLMFATSGLALEVSFWSLWRMIEKMMSSIASGAPS